MTSKIRILDETTINQIAAGEVIENPASVIKELVDNALDANATQIQIVATNSGRQTIRVQDDGSGMSHDDAILSIERHATSKLRSIEDLFGITSMGFRGEALSSIASVSQMRLLTAPNAGDKSLVKGTCVTVHGGKILSHQRVECLAGTDIEVSSLFYNVPARRKFLKSPAKDASDIIKVVMQLALAHPKIAFELVVNQEKVFSLLASTLAERIKATLGNEFYAELISVHDKNEHFTIDGYICQPHYSRPTRTAQYLFINQRPVSSLFISTVVKEAYGTALESGRHPAFVLSIEMSKELLDVNVHPQKREVRFSCEEALKGALLKAISQALFSQKPFQKATTQEFSYPAAAAPYEFQQATRTTSFEVVPLEVIQPSFVPMKPQAQVQGFFKEYLFVEINWQERIIPDGLQQEGIYLVSVPQALARIAYDGAEKESEVTTRVSQNLLVPLFLELSPPDAERLKEQIVPLSEAGICVREFGHTSFLVEAIPSYMKELDVEEALRLLASEDNQSSVSQCFAKIAASGKRNVAPSKELGEQIMQKLLNCKNPFVSPFGERIVALLTDTELEKKFRS